MVKMTMKGVVLLKDHLFIWIFDDDWAIDEILDKVWDIPKCQWETQVRKGLEQGDKDFKIKEGLVEWKGRVYIPANIWLCESLIAIYHSWGHSGVAKTVEALTRDLWWPNMKKDVEKYIPGCEVCQKAKPDRQPRAAPLHPNEIPKEPWEIISVDLIGPLPESKGNDMILVIVDQFTKKSYFLPTTSSITSQGVAVLFQDNIFRDHGIPWKVISDRGTQFISKFMDDLYGMLGIKANWSTAYHPQTDGQTEWVNQEVKEFLTMFVNH